MSVAPPLLTLYLTACALPFGSSQSKTSRFQNNSPLISKHKTSEKLSLPVLWTSKKMGHKQEKWPLAINYTFLVFKMGHALWSTYNGWSISVPFLDCKPEKNVLTITSVVFDWKVIKKEHKADVFTTEEKCVLYCLSLMCRNNISYLASVRVEKSVD